MSLMNKVFDINDLQIYLVDNNLISSDYLKIEVVNNKTTITKSDRLPSFSLDTKGFILVRRSAKNKPKFLKPNFTKSTNLIIDRTEYKTNFVYQPNAFINTKRKIVLNCKPKLNSYPNVNTSVMIKTDTIDADKILKQFIKHQVEVKSIKQFINYLIKYCPYHVHYKLNIKPEDFKHKITVEDMIIDYDIHATNEIELVYMIEEAFESFDVTVKIHNNYNQIIYRIKDECDRLGLDYVLSTKSDIPFIELNYNDLNKCNIEYTLTDFMN